MFLIYVGQWTRTVLFSRTQLMAKSDSLAQQPYQSWTIWSVSRFLASSAIAHCCAVFSVILVGRMYDHHRTPNRNDRDHLVGQLTSYWDVCPQLLPIVWGETFFLKLLLILKNQEICKLWLSRQSLGLQGPSIYYVSRCRREAINEIWIQKFIALLKLYTWVICLLELKASKWAGELGKKRIIGWIISAERFQSVQFECYRQSIC